MGVIAIPNTFSANTTISSSQVNANFTTIYDEFNGAISAANLATGAVTAAKLATDAVETAKIKDANVTTAKIANSAIDYTKVANGAVVQVVNTNSTAVATGTETIPVDDTIPQNTEGKEYMTLAITPKSTTNVLVIDCRINLAHSGATVLMAAALFQDTTANALAATSGVVVGANDSVVLNIRHSMTAGTTSATTFKVRAGSNGEAGTTTFNGISAARIYGAITKSSIIITEYKAS